jgi:IclR family acetate operon transcriptional repressor
MASHRPRHLQSVNHALRALNLFSPNRSHWSVTQVAGTLGLSKSTASRLLSTMAAEGFVSKDSHTGLYGLGVRAYEVGLAYLSGLSLRRAAMPSLEEVAFAVHETVYLGILGDRAAIYIDKILSPLSLRVDSHIGVAVPLHATALGKVLLASQPAHYIDALVAAGLQPYTRRTITTPQALRAEIRLVRTQGFAVDLEEFEENLHCIAFPLLDHRGSVVGAFSVSGPAVRLTRQDMDRNLPLFRQAASTISERLGFKGSREMAPPAASEPGRPAVPRSRVRTSRKGG